MAEMWAQSELTAMRRNHGDWHIALQNLPENEIEEIIKRSDVAYSSWYSEINENADQGYYVGDKNVVIYGAEEAYLTDIRKYPADGSYPQTESEVALSAEAKELLVSTLAIRSFSIRLPEILHIPFLDFMKMI